MEPREGTENIEIYKKALCLSPRGLFSAIAISQTLMLFASRTNYLKLPHLHFLHNAVQVGGQSWVPPDICFSSYFFSGT